MISDRSKSIDLGPQARNSSNVFSKDSAIKKVIILLNTVEEIHSILHEIKSEDEKERYEAATY